MPDKLKQFLDNLGADDAAEIWEYLDISASAIEDIIDIVAPIAEGSNTPKSG